SLQGSYGCLHEARAGLRDRKSAWLEHMARQEKLGQGERIGEVGGLRLRGRLGLGQEGRQTQEPVVPGLAGRARDGPPGSRRDIDQIRIRSRGRAAFEIEPEAELGK